MSDGIGGGGVAAVAVQGAGAGAGERMTQEIQGQDQIPVQVAGMLCGIDTEEEGRSCGIHKRNLTRWRQLAAVCRYIYGFDWFRSY